MSNSVYGFCNAGCRYRVPTYDDFLASAAYARLTPNEEGKFILEKGKTYKIKKDSLTSLGFQVQIPWSGVSANIEDLVKGTLVCDFIECDQYEEYLTIRILDFYSRLSDESLVTVVELDGVRGEYTAGVGDYYYNLTAEFVVVDATECLVVNSDAQILIDIENMDEVVAAVIAALPQAEEVSF